MPEEHEFWDSYIDFWKINPFLYDISKILIFLFSDIIFKCDDLYRKSLSQPLSFLKLFVQIGHSDDSISGHL